MDLEVNTKTPKIMHIDLNSCFATIEQQANPLLRNRPIAIAAYNSPGGCIVSPSIEAKRLGIKVGFRVKDARVLCPSIVILTPDPAKYRDVHIKFKKIFQSYSPSVTPKSIDEAVLDFTDFSNQKRDLVDIGGEIKLRLRNEIGEWISCNVGIGTNRFLAKLAASLHKPDGLDVINKDNIRQIYSQINLMDLCGISHRLKARLNDHNIHTPQEFFAAPLFVLWKQVFRSVSGYYWYLRLRGYEIDKEESKRSSFGQSYALYKKTDNELELQKILLKLTEKMGRRLRKANYSAQGTHVAIEYIDRTYWHKGQKFTKNMYTTPEIFQKIKMLFALRPKIKKISKISISCFCLSPMKNIQLNLFESDYTKRRLVARSVDKINDLYGEFVITPALMANMDDLILDRIAFGGVKELEDLYDDTI